MKTGCNTLLIGLIIVALPVIYSYYKKEKRTIPNISFFLYLKPPLTDVVRELMIWTILFIWNVWFLYDRSGVEVAPYTDYVYYANVSIRKQEENKIHAYIFSRYMEKQQQAGTFTSIAQSRLDFIKEHSIDFMFATKNVIVDTLIWQLVKKKLLTNAPGNGC